MEWRSALVWVAKVIEFREVVQFLNQSTSAQALEVEFSEQKVGGCHS